jgi:hypothetical protein
MKIDVFDIEALIAHHRLREAVPRLRKVVADMAAMADGNVASYNEGTAIFLKGLPADSFRTPVVDRLLRAYVHRFQRDVVLAGQYRRASVRAALFGA